MTSKYTACLTLLSVCYLSCTISLAFEIKIIKKSDQAQIDNSLAPKSTINDWKKIYQQAAQKVEAEKIRREGGMYAQQSDTNRYLKFALDEARKFGDQDPRVADALILQARYKELGGNLSIDEYTQALAIQEKAFGQENAKLVDTLSALAKTYARRQKYAEANACFVRG